MCICICICVRDVRVFMYIGITEGTQVCDSVLLALDGVYLDSPRRGPYVNHLTMLQV